MLTLDLTRCELRRALEAAEAGAAARREVGEWQGYCALIRLTRELCDRAGGLLPGVGLRSLDALHTAAALSLGQALAAFVAYDQRLVDAAKQAGRATAAALRTRMRGTRRHSRAGPGRRLPNAQ